MEDFYLNHSGVIQILAILFTGLATYFSWITYRRTFFSKPIEEKENLLALFKSTQKLSLKLRNEIIQYATENNKMDSYMFEGISFSKYISMMEVSYNENLSDQLYQKIKNMELSKSNIASMTESLEKQIEALNILEANMKVL